MEAREAARGIVRCCRRLWEAGLIAGADGNVSVRLRPDRILITPRGMLKADLKTTDLVPVDLSGRARGGTRRPTTELDLHLALYRADPGIGAVVHAHPPIATGHAVAGVSLDCSALPELLLLMGRTVPLVPFAIPGTPEVGAGVAPLAARHHAALLANHGAVTWGTDLRMAQVRMESLEHAARILAAARAVGRIRRMPRPAIDVLSPRMGRKRDG